MEKNPGMHQKSAQVPDEGAEIKEHNKEAEGRRRPWKI